MVSRPPVPFAARIASRSEMRPSTPGLPTSAATEAVLPSIVSAVVVTSRLPTTWRGALNSDVLFAGSVAVAVMYSPDETAAKNVTPKTA